MQELPDQEEFSPQGHLRPDDKPCGTGHHSRLRANVDNDPMLLGGYDDLGPQAGPPLLKTVPRLPVGSKPPPAAAGGSRSGAQAHVFHASSPDVLAVLAWGWAYHPPTVLCGGSGAETCKPATAGCGKDFVCTPAPVSTLASALLAGSPACRMTPECLLWVLAGGRER